MRSWVLILALALEPLTLKVRPQIMIRRGDIQIEVRVARNADNRLLSIAWTSDHGSAGSTLRGLDGDDAAVLHTLTIPSAVPSNYLFVAAVFNAKGKQTATATATIRTTDDDGGA